MFMHNFVFNGLCRFGELWELQNVAVVFPPRPVSNLFPTGKSNFQVERQNQKPCRLTLNNHFMHNNFNNLQGQAYI